MRDHTTAADGALDPTIVLRQKEQPEWAVITQDQHTGDTIVTVQEGLFEGVPLLVLRDLLLTLGRNYHPGLPEPVRQRLRDEHLREEAERVAQMSRKERELHEAREKIYREMMDRVDALEAAS